MKNIYEMIRQKEMQLERLKSELQALRLAAPLLEEDLTEEPPLLSMPVRPDRPAQTRTASPPSGAQSTWP
jgi:hypothetical protein